MSQTRSNQSAPVVTSRKVKDVEWKVSRVHDIGTSWLQKSVRARAPRKVGQNPIYAPTVCTRPASRRAPAPRRDGVFCSLEPCRALESPCTFGRALQLAALCAPPSRQAPARKLKASSREAGTVTNKMRVPMTAHWNSSPALLPVLETRLVPVSAEHLPPPSLFLFLLKGRQQAISLHASSFVPFPLCWISSQLLDRSWPCVCGPVFSYVICGSGFFHFKLCLSQSRFAVSLLLARYPLRLLTLSISFSPRPSQFVGASLLPTTYPRAASHPYVDSVCHCLYGRNCLSFTSTQHTRCPRSNVRLPARLLARIPRSSGRMPALLPSSVLPKPLPERFRPMVPSLLLPAAPPLHLSLLLPSSTRLSGWPR